MKLLHLFLTALITVNLSNIRNFENIDEKKDTNYNFIISEQENYFYEDSNYVIYGNYNDFNLDEFYEVIKDNSRIAIFYDINIEDNIDKEYELFKNNVSIFYTINNVLSIHTMQSTSDVYTLIFNEISDFVNEKLEQINNKKETRSITDNLVFTTLYSSSFRKIHKPYGYVDCDYVVKKYRTNDISSLYIIESHMYFTPGKVANDNGDNTYENYYNKSGFMRLKAMEAEKVVGNDQTRYGGTPVFKDAYPVNNPGTITIGSTYSSGVTMGYSFTNGFSSDSIEVTIGSDMGANIVYSYSKMYTNTEPALTTQKNSNDSQQYEWVYKYNVARDETNHLITGYVFEMNNRGHDLEEGDVMFRYNYKLGVKKKVLGIFGLTEEICEGTSLNNYYTV